MGLTYIKRADTHVEKGEWDQATADCAAVLRAGIERMSDIFYPLDTHGCRLRLEFGDPDKLHAADIYVALGAGYLGSKAYGRASARFDKAAELDPQHARADYYRGIIRGEKGDFDGAVADFAKALPRGDSKLVRLARDRVCDYVRKRSPEQTIADCRMIILLDPENSEATMPRRELRENRGDGKGHRRLLGRGLPAESADRAHARLAEGLHPPRQGPPGQSRLGRRGCRFDRGIPTQPRLIGEGKPASTAAGNTAATTASPDDASRSIWTARLAKRAERFTTQPVRRVPILATGRLLGLDGTARPFRVGQCPHEARRSAGGQGDLGRAIDDFTVALRLTNQNIGSSPRHYDVRKAARLGRATRIRNAASMPRPSPT